MKIVIDPGHGGRDGGAVGNGLKEKDITLSLAKRIRDILFSEYEDVEVLLTRETDIFIELSERARMANEWGADYFLSIHVNAGGGTGFESFIHDSQTPPSVALQNIIHAEIMKAIPEVTNRGRKVANFAVLRQTQMPAILTENLFIDNIQDAQKLKDPVFLERLARGHVKGLERAFGLKKKGNYMLHPDDANKIIRFLSAGWFVVQGNKQAEAEFNRLANELRKVSGQEPQ